MVSRHPFEKLRFLGDSDPGLLRLRQACRTLAAVAVSLALFWRAGFQTRMFAAAGAAYIMQCSSTGPWRRRQKTMLITGLAMAAVVGLGGALKGHHWCQDLLIVLVAALAYYVRRFLPDRSQFPIFGFILCILAAVLSTGLHQGLQDMSAVAAGLPVAFTIYFYVLPPRCTRAARDELHDFCRDAAELLERPWDHRQFELLASRPATLQAIADDHPDHAAAPLIREAVNDQYALLESLLVIGLSKIRSDLSTPGTPGRSGPGLHPPEPPEITSTVDGLVDLPSREAAQQLSARLATERLDRVRARLASAAAALADLPGGCAS